MKETPVHFLGWEDPLREGMATHSPWTEEPGGLQSMGLQSIWHNWVTKHRTEHLGFSMNRLWGNISSVSSITRICERFRLTRVLFLCYAMMPLINKYIFKMYLIYILN